MDEINQNHVVQVDEMVAQKLLEKAAKLDESLSKKHKRVVTDIERYTKNLIYHGSIEVGYRSSCGKTDHTMYVYREWVKLLKYAARLGVVVDVTQVKHGSAYATNNGGFWDSSIYAIAAIRSSAF